MAGVGKLCVLLYDDINGDAIRQETEPSLPGGAISVSNRSGSFSETVPSESGLDPHCFENLSEGEYSITVAVPNGYNPTTATSFVLNLKAEDETYIGFGAQVNSDAQLESPEVSGTRRSPLLGIIGGVLLIASFALAIFGTRLLRGK
jgi:hypothetical protein